MKLGSKIVLPVLLLLLITLGSFGYLLFSLKQQEIVIFEQETKIQKLNSLNERLNRQQDITVSSVLDYRFSKDKASLLAISQAELDKSKTLDEMFPFITTSRGRELINSYIDARKDIEPLRNELIQAIDEGNKDQIKLAYNRWSIQTQNIKAALADIGAFNINSLEKTLAAVGVIRDKLVQIIIILVLVVVSTILFLLFYLRAVITTPIIKLAKFADQIAQQDFTTTTTTTGINSTDEIGQLFRSFNTMSIKLKEFYETLEEKVKQRTQDLEDSKNAMQNLVEDLEEISEDLEKFKLAIENTTEMVLITDNKGIVVYGSKAVEKITGYSLEEVIGIKAGKLYGGQMSEDFYQQMWKIISVDKKPFASELTNKRKNGENYIANLIISPILSKSGEVLFYVSVERDISKEKEVDKAKTEFVSLASHQLRTPLGIIKWYLEAWKNETDFKKSSAVVRSYFDEIYKSNERVLSLVRDLLSVSRIEQGRVKNDPKPADVIQVISEIVKQMQIIALKRKVLLHLTIKDKSIPPINIDILRFHEVIENLVSNAIQYTLALGKVEVTVDTQSPSSNKNNATVVISIKDSGMGMSIEDKSHIFDKFFRSQRAIEVNPEGSGLGLYLVKSYVEAWGGKISVESTLGEGSTFTISLPISQNNKPFAK